MNGGPLKRIGVLTGGGDCPGLNAVIRAVVKAATGNYGLGVTGIEDGYEGLILPGKTRDLTLKDIRGILPRGGTILGTTNRANPFAWTAEKNGKLQVQDVSAKVISHIEFLGLDALVVIGGDGSLKIAQRLWHMGVPVIGIPKTIDNDISATDVTFGFHTAVTTAMDALDKLHSTAESHHRVMVVEVMGRYAGWIALEAGMAGGADIILIPEIPFDPNLVCQKIFQRREGGSRFSIVVVAEGAHPTGEETVVKECAVGAKYTERLGGIGEKVGDLIAKRTGMDVRVLVLGHIQRGGSPTWFDRNLGSRFGTAAVKALMQEEFGKIVCLRTPRIELATLEEAVGVMKAVDPEGELVRTAETLGIMMGR
jgi:ATP-dependent phosphofructokinase / diphosphate-dependent phosphofructokinase